MFIVFLGAIGGREENQTNNIKSQRFQIIGLKLKFNNNHKMQQNEEIVTSQIASLKKSFITDSKKEFENVFKCIYALATILSAVLLRKVYLFQTMDQFANIRQGTTIDFLHYSLPFGIAFTVFSIFTQLFDLSFHYFFDDLIEKYYLTETKYEGKARQRRAYTLAKWCYSVVYYFISSVAGIYILKDTSFFPTWLGGNGSCSNLFADLPYLNEATYGMKLYYLLQFGKHASRLFSHMFIKQQGNYYEYVLHHALSTFLILFSYLTNQWVGGSMVLICHDVSDLFLIMGRGYKDYKNYSKNVLKVIYVFGLITWIGGRLVVFPICCVWPTLRGPVIPEDRMTELQADILLLPIKCMGFMLFFLQGLQIFWSYYICKAFVEVNVSSKIASNTYE